MHVNVHAFLKGFFFFFFFFFFAIRFQFFSILQEEIEVTDGAKCFFNGKKMVFYQLR